jgi:hypothetical protein
MVVKTREQMVKEDTSFWHKFHDQHDGIDVIDLGHEELL